MTRFLGLLTLPLFTAHLTPEEYGVLAMLTLLTMVAHSVFSLGLSAAMGSCYFEVDNSTNKSKAVWTVFALNSLSSTVLIAIAWMFPETLARLVRLPPECANLVGLSLTGSAISIVAIPFIQRVQFEKQAKLYVLATLASAFTAVLISILMVIFLSMGAKGMVLGQFAGNLVTFMAFLLIGIKSTKPLATFAMAKVLLRQGLPLVTSFGFLFILMHANKYMLEWQVGLDAVGIYAIGFSFGMVISIVTGGIATAWYPFFMSYINRQSEARVIFGRVFIYSLYGVGLICVLIYFSAKPIVMLLTKDLFHEAYLVVGLVALANFFQIVFNLFLPGIYFQKEIKYVSVIQGLAALCSFPINYYLIANLNVLGAGIGLAVNNSLMAGLMYGWNYLNRERYVVIQYDWRRVFHFSILMLFFILIYSVIPVKTVSDEFSKSIFMILVTLLGMIFLLRKSERLFLIGLVRVK